MNLNSPEVHIWSSTAAGGFSGEVVGYRTNRKGEEVEVAVNFPALSRHELRCIARTAMAALRAKRRQLQGDLDVLRDEANL